MSVTDACGGYDAAVAMLNRNIVSRPEAARDQSFLTALFIQCSPLRQTLPMAMMEPQAQLQQRSYRDAYPRAMRRIIMRDEAPIARVMIDWSSPTQSRLVDIAVAPTHQRLGIGTALLHAWLNLADADNCRCQLAVLADNPAQMLYKRLGFVERADSAPPFLQMERAARGL